MKKIIVTTEEELQQFIEASVQRAVKAAMPEAKQQEEFGDIKFASQITGLSVSTLCKYSSDKKKNLPVITGTSDLLRFSRTDLIAWMRSKNKK
ncbi:MAG: hypothetical protein NT084_13340 [Bacteroidetes bacterium]|nr:hypothetical protein [Bacteroidota bacterium]